MNLINIRLHNINGLKIVAQLSYYIFTHKEIGERKNEFYQSFRCRLTKEV